jgi:hypothetical protein
MTAKFLKQIESVKKSALKLNIEITDDILIETAQELGPSIYNADSKFINTSDQTELDIVRDEFIIKKLKVSDADIIKELIYEAIMIIDPLKNKKYRILFYAILKILLKTKFSSKPTTDTPQNLSWWQKLKQFLFKK